jgi:hypothetical protein
MVLFAQIFVIVIARLALGQRQEFCCLCLFFLLVPFLLGDPLGLCQFFVLGPILFCNPLFLLGLLLSNPIYLFFFSLGHFSKLQ